MMDIARVKISKQLYDKAKLLRGWGRSSATFNESEKIEDRFNVKISGIQYDKKYIFSELGYMIIIIRISNDMRVLCNSVYYSCVVF